MVCQAFVEWLVPQTWGPADLLNTCGFAECQHAECGAAAVLQCSGLSARFEPQQSYAFLTSIGGGLCWLLAGCVADGAHANCCRLLVVYVPADTCTCVHLLSVPVQPRCWWEVVEQQQQQLRQQQQQQQADVDAGAGEGSAEPAAAAAAAAVGEAGPSYAVQLVTNRVSKHAISNSAWLVLQHALYCVVSSSNCKCHTM